MENYSNGSSNSASNSENMPAKEVHVLKFVILGDSNVGKTSILHHFMFNKCKNFKYQNKFYFQMKLRRNQNIL